MKNARLTLLAVGLISLLGFFIIILHRPAKVADVFQKAGSNLQQPTLIGNDLYFFTGSSFARFDTQTNRSTLLSSYFYTQGEITVGSWSNNSVLFATAGTAADDIFGSALSASGKDPSSTHWWRYDFNQHAMELLDFKGADTCVNVVEVTPKLYCFAPYLASAHNYSLLSYDLGSHVSNAAIRTTTPVSSVTARGKNIYYLTTALNGSQSLSVYDTSSKSARVLIKSKDKLSYVVANDQNVLLQQSPLANNLPVQSRDHSDTSTPTTGHQSLILLNSASKITAKVNANGQAGKLSESGNSLVSARSGNLYIANKNSIKTYATKLQDIALAWKIDDNIFYLDADNNLLVNKHVTPLKSGYDFNPADNAGPKSFYVSEVVNNRNVTYVNDSSKDFAGNALGVDSFLKTRGYDPSQFNFDWNILNVSSSTSLASQVITLK